MPNVGSFEMRDHFIGGRWIDGRGQPFTAADPTHSERPFTTRTADPDEVETACAAADEARPIWADLSFDRRAVLAMAYAAILDKEKDSLARLISQETGKPAWESRAEVDTMIRKVTLSIDAYKMRTGYREQELGDGARSVLSHQPHGTVAVLGPFNFPGHLPNGHIVPALLAGNTVIFKPSECTPGVGALMVRCWDRAGLPKGVLNLVQGDRSTAIHLLEDRRVAGVYFTGSANAGIAIHRLFAGRPDVVLALEMGGNNPLVVVGSEDPVEKARIAAISAFITAGQRCTCARRLVVTPEAERVIDELVALTRLIIVGTPDSVPVPFIGPVIHSLSATRILAAQNNLVERGGMILEEVRPTEQGVPFLRPGIVDATGITNMPDEEIFGPVLQVVRVESFEKAIAVANSTRFGLAAGLVGGTPDQFGQFRRRVRAGVINWNRPTTGASSALPFGGLGLSGNHRPTAFYAADYCAYPVASLESEKPVAPKQVGLS
jgi:succinylglutamic semialdehyde dehydrogenase